MLLAELTTSARQYLLNRGYTKTTIYHNYVWHWNSFSKTLDSNADYDIDLLVSYITQQYGKNLLLMTPEEMSHREYIRYVAFRALDRFFKTATIPGTSMLGSLVRQSLSQGSNVALHRFMEHLDELEYKPKPKKYSYNTVHSFLYSCPIEAMNSEQILNYLLSLGSKAKVTAKSEQKVIKRFLLFVWQNGLTDQDFSQIIISTKKRKNTVIPSVYAPEEVILLLNYLKSYGKNCLRNYAIAVLIAVYGFRACDMVKLKLSDIDWDNGRIRIIQDKTSVELNHKLTDFCGNVLVDYLLNKRPSTASNLVFIKTDGEPLSSTAISSMIFYGFIHSGININGRKHSSHSLRHSLASNMLKLGTNLLNISHVLGHTGIESTMIYTKIDVPHLRMCELEVPIYEK
jgi:integrase/recombinase XerD